MENGKTREPQQKRSIEKKNKIIETGFTLMCEKGYQKTTTADIAKAAGVSTGIIYSYFQDKHDIFIAGLRLFGDKLLTPMFATLTPSVDFREALSHIIDILIEGHKVFGNAHKEIEALTMTDPEVSAFMLELEDVTTKRLVSFLNEDGIVCDDLLERTHIIYNMVESLCHEIIFHNHEYLDAHRMKDIVIETVLTILHVENENK